MMPSNPYQFNSRSSISRSSLITILNAAIETSAFRFARQAAMSWLAIYPGDLEISLLLAEALSGEGKTIQALEIVERLLLSDPEFVEAHFILYDLYKKMGNEDYKKEEAILYGLGWDSSGEIEGLKEWAHSLRNANDSIQKGLVQEAVEFFPMVLTESEISALPAILHLKSVMTTQDVHSLKNLAEIYHARWKDCLQFQLCLAKTRLETGDETGALGLLHDCVSKDATAQVAKRLWGKEFPFKPLWPQHFEIRFDIPIPAEVAAILGWNILAGGAVTTQPPEEPVIADLPDVNLENEALKGSGSSEKSFESDVQEIESYLAEKQPEDAIPGEVGPVEVVIDENSEDVSSEIPSNAAVADLEPESINQSVPEPDWLPAAPTSWDQETDLVALDESQPEIIEDEPVLTEAIGFEAQPTVVEKKKLPEDLKPIQDAFDRLAAKYDKTSPKSTDTDNRFPMYVVFSSAIGLEKVYGLQTKAVIDTEMKRLADALRQRTGWGSMVYYPDDIDSTNKIGVTTTETQDPWKFKLALSDLDKALAKKGAMIGALLIVGGDDVVPFHHLPNPTEDSDEEILSDNPYGALDSNYFVGEWPVGRIPGGTGSDAGLILEQLRNFTRYHLRSKGKPKGNVSIITSIFEWLMSLLKIKTSLTKSLGTGYTASVWRQASEAVFKPIGQSSDLLVSPPQFSGSFEMKKILNAGLGYFNLHGLVDTSDWYGQRDVTEPYTGPDYPIALSPKDLLDNGSAPQIVFSEACYGAHIVKKNEDQSLALKFLSIGTQAFIGCTCTSYGSVNTPLIGADLLGYLFWKYIKEGYSAGEALKQAKLEFIQLMNKRQGYLDSEDQKALISFVFYGDPLTFADKATNQAKHPRRTAFTTQVKMVSEKQNENSITHVQVSNEVIRDVKQMVEVYLPGLDNAHVVISKQRLVGGAQSNNSSEEKSRQGSTGKVVVTMTKTVQTARHVHHHYARATLDNHGKVVKLAISR